MSNDVLIGQYPKQQCVRDRNYTALLQWAGYTAELPVPPDKPTDQWVRNRIVAERIPTQIDSYLQRTLPYFMQDPAVIQDLHDFLNAWNDQSTEDGLSSTNASVIGAFMPRFALTDVSDQQVTDWYTAHGFA